jgi:lipopolysaccharide transport system permease protein
MAEQNDRMLKVIRPGADRIGVEFSRLREYRELLFFLVWRDLKVRYKQTALGVTWAVLQPLATMVVFSVVFGRLAKIPSDGVPYPIFAYCALVPWQMFAFALTESSNSMMQNQYLISKIYFPRLIVPLTPVFTAMVDFLLAFALLIAMMPFYGVVPKLTILLLPVFLLLVVLTSFAVGVWVSALTAEYRDIRYTIPFLVQSWMFVTPIAYPSSLVPQKWRMLYGLNPMTSVVEGFRWVLLGTPAPPLMPMLVSGLAVVVILCGGVMHFRRLESTFADVL